MEEVPQRCVTSGDMSRMPLWLSRRRCREADRVTKQRGEAGKFNYKQPAWIRRGIRSTMELGGGVN